MGLPALCLVLDDTGRVIYYGHAVKTQGQGVKMKPGPIFQIEIRLFIMDDLIFSRCLLFVFFMTKVSSLFCFFIYFTPTKHFCKTILMKVLTKICYCLLHKLIKRSFSRQHKLCWSLCLNWTLLNLPCYLVPCQKHSRMVPPNSCITTSRMLVTPVWWVLGHNWYLPLYWSWPLLIPGLDMPWEKGQLSCSLLVLWASGGWGPCLILQCSQGMNELSI